MINPPDELETCEQLLYTLIGLRTTLVLKGFGSLHDIDNTRFETVMDTLFHEEESRGGIDDEVLAEIKRGKGR